MTKCSHAYHTVHRVRQNKGNPSGLLRAEVAALGPLKMVLGDLGPFFHCCFASNSCEQTPLTLEFLFSNLTISLPLGRHGAPMQCTECSREHESVCPQRPAACRAHLADHEPIRLATSGRAENIHQVCRAGRVHPQLPALSLSKEGWTVRSCQEVFLTHKACFLRYSHLLRLLFLLEREILLMVPEALVISR